MAELSQQLAERAARLAETKQAAATTGRTALETYDRAGEGRMIWGLSAVVTAGIAAGIAYLLLPIGSPPVPLPSGAATRTEPVAPIATATAAPARLGPAPLPTAPSSPSQAASLADTPAVALAAAAPVQATVAAGGASARPMMTARAGPAPVTASRQPVAAPASNEPPLLRDEVREVQAMLRSFGFNPGPVDGIPGRMTDAAVMRYQEARAQPQIGKVDRDLLEQLRQDPAPQVVQP